MTATIVRIKLDFIIQCSQHGIPWFGDVNALIVDGLAKTVPTATRVMPGARVEMTDLGLRARLAEERRKAKADKKASKPKRKARTP